MKECCGMKCGETVPGNTVNVPLESGCLRPLAVNPPQNSIRLEHG